MIPATLLFALSEVDGRATSEMMTMRGSAATGGRALEKLRRGPPASQVGRPPAAMGSVLYDGSLDSPRRGPGKPQAEKELARIGARNDQAQETALGKEGER